MTTNLGSFKQSPPPTLPGFQHIKRVWNATFAAYTARILPGELYITLYDEGVTTTLGSCIAACIRDRMNGVGGMNHFMLPTGGSELLGGANNSAATRYGMYAMEQLINHILRNGGKRQYLEAKIFGGGRIIPNMSDVGLRNIAFVREYLETEGLSVVAEDVGDVFPRMVAYFPATGRARVKRLRSLHNNVIASQERSYVETIKKTPASGELELF